MSALTQPSAYPISYAAERHGRYLVGGRGPDA
jgi:hypothetical protein